MGKERRYSLILPVVSIAVLAAGTLVRLFTPPEPPLTPPHDLERLQRLTFEQRLRDQSEYLAEKAAAFGRRLVSPAGLAWDVGVVIAPPAPPGRNAATVGQATGVPSNSSARRRRLRLPSVSGERPGRLCQRSPRPVRVPATGCWR